MTLKVVKTGQEPTIREAVDWLERKGIPATLIRAVRIDAGIGQPIRLSVDLYVDNEDEAPASPENRGQVMAEIPAEVWESEPMRQIAIMQAVASLPAAAERMGGRLVGEYRVDPPVSEDDSAHVFQDMERLP